MELRQLQFVVLLSEELHFRRAAERAHIAQPAFSEQIRRLEQELGAQLFERTSHYVRMTEAGRLFVEEVHQALAQVDRAAEVAEQAARGEIGHIRVGFVGFAADELTPPIVRAFTRGHAMVQVTLRGFDFTDPTAGLADGDVDVGFIHPPVDGQDALVIVPLLREPRVAIVADDHALAEQPTVSIRDLLNERFVASPRSAGVWREFWLATEYRDGTPPDIAGEASTVDELLQIVAAGAGIALVPASSARFHARPGVRFVPVSDIATTTVAVARAAGAPSPLVRAFLEVARSVAGECGDRAAVSRHTDLVLAET
jgi:DNA-binding transcriptional LysR family regulator